MNPILLRACAFLVLAVSASAEIIGVDTFDYPNAAIAGQNGGTFWDFKNVAPAGHTGTASDWDTVFGAAPVVASGRLVTNNSGAKREYNGASENQGAVNDANVNKVVYYRVTVTTGATLPEFFVLSSYDFGTERLVFGKVFGEANFGLSILGQPVVNSSVAIQTNTTYTLVVKISYPGDTISLFINPDLNAGEPAAHAFASFPNTEWSTAVRLSSGFNGDAIQWDNLVVATTWDELGAVVTTTANEDDGSLNPALGSGVSLREAVNHAPAGSLVTFDPVLLSGQTIALGGTQLLVNKSLTIDASDLPRSPTIDARGLSRVLKINPGGYRLTLDSLTLTGGRVLGSGSVEAEADGGIFSEAAALRVHRCTLFDNAASARGIPCFGIPRISGIALASAGADCSYDCGARRLVSPVSVLSPSHL